MRSDDDVIAFHERAGDFVTDVDGYAYFWPSGHGHYAAWHLRAIAAGLDAKNREWDDIVQNDPLIGGKQ